MGVNQLGPFQLTGVLGRGGMGTVYRATDMNSGDEVALKALAPAFSFDPHFRNRFEAEVETLLKLDHPNIVRLLSNGQDDGNLYYAMELVNGKSLFQWHRDGYRFAWYEVLEISLDICAALRHAHDRGVIHRDLKPGNVMRTNEGIIKLTDFGIAKIFGRHQMTGEGRIVGTLDYMSPEQALGKPVTVRSDLYSLGAVMYALIARRPVHRGDDMTDTLRRIVKSAPTPIGQLVPEVPAAMQRVIHELLEKKPERRVPTAQLLRRRLEELREQYRGTSEAATNIVPAADRPSGDASSDGDDDEYRLAPVDPARTRVAAATERPRGEQTAGKSRGVETPPAPPVKPVKPAAAATSPATGRSTHTGNVEPLAAPGTFFATATARRHEELAAAKSQANRTTLVTFAVITVGLLAVVALLALGINHLLLRQPSEPALIAKIDAADRPTQVRDELRQFVQLYPQHPRADEFQQLLEVADAQVYRNQLQLRARMPRRELSPIEQQFLQVTGLEASDPMAAYSQLVALVRLHTSDEELSEEDQRALRAARGYMRKLEQDAARHVDQGRQSIENALQRARRLAEEDQMGEAARILQSIIELYEQHDWAADLVDQARQLLEEWGYTTS